MGSMRRRKGIGLEIEAEEGSPQSPESLAEIGQWEVGWWGRVYSASLGGNLGTRGLFPQRKFRQERQLQGAGLSWKGAVG